MLREAPRSEHLGQVIAPDHVGPGPQDQQLGRALRSDGAAEADDLAHLHLHSIMFSIDSVTKETLKKIRGIDKLEKIESAVFRMMKVRGAT